MPLSPGDRLGHYEIVELIGKGGMGEVYRAHDSRVGRDVAIKISTAQFSERFTREARAIAQLNHPNICTLFDVGPNFLVMELVEGPTLADRIGQGPIPMDEALKIVYQIAAALEEAHEKGVIHRDLKPANIKIKPDGLVKVLDFGLAKVAPASAGGSSENAATLTMLAVSKSGTILGTAAYMAPEQARGLQVDRRADIWAFGVVVWEMLTGEMLFQGPTVTDILAQVVTKTPDYSSVPPRAKKLLERCLNRDPRERLRDIGEARFLLQEEPVMAPGIGTAPSPSRFGHGAAGAIWPAATAVAALAALGLGYVAYKHYTEEPPLLKMALPVPEKTQLANAGAIPAISPDGRHVAFAANVDGRIGLWLRDLDASSARELPGTVNAGYPFWSPDSRWVGFFADGRLKKIDVTGGPALVLCDVAQGRGGTWNQEDVIVYGTTTGLFRVPAAGGTPARLSELDHAASETTHRAPWFLPDGRHFLYTVRAAGDPQKTRIYVESVDAKPGSKTGREVLAADSNAVYVPSIHRKPAGGGYLIFVRDHTAMAQPFDAANAKTTGDAAAIAEQVDTMPSNSQGQFSASQNGILVYTSGATAAGNMQITWFDRSGKQVGTVGTPSQILWATLSPDGSTVAADLQDSTGGRDIWLHDLARGTESRFTFGPALNDYPLWSADGSKIVFYSVRDGNGNPYEKAASGVGQEEVLDKDPRNNRVDDWSRDGRYLIEEVIDSKTASDIWVIPTFGDKKPFAYLNSGFNEENAKLSPNGQFLAYSSDETKRDEVYVQTFPEHGGKWQVSTGGGSFPMWSRDGRELYFIGADRKMMAVAVSGSGNKFEAGVPKALFEVRAADQFDVSKDGRFLLKVPRDAAAANVPITVVVNWEAGVRR
jgi:Tol biopolymer transport system component/predicted Ser/Thr protein kinase